MVSQAETSLYLPLADVPGAPHSQAAAQHQRHARRASRVRLGTYFATEAASRRCAHRRQCTYLSQRQGAASTVAYAGGGGREGGGAEGQALISYSLQGIVIHVRDKITCQV